MEGKEQVQVQLQIVDENFVTINVSEFWNLVDKAARLDAITESIKQSIDAGNASYEHVNDKLIMLLTGTYSYKPPKQEDKDE